MLISLKDAPKRQVNGMDHADKIAVNTSEKCMCWKQVFLFLSLFISYNLVNVM